VIAGIGIVIAGIGIVITGIGDRDHRDRHRDRPDRAW